MTRNPTNTSELPASVAAMGRIPFTGNIIPPQWLTKLRRPSGEPYALAALLLGEIVYWYRPCEVRDEGSGQVIGWRKKFKADKLQRSYGSFASQFGFTKRQCTEAVHFLRDQGIITLEFRTLHTGQFNDLILNNVLFIEIVPEAVAALCEVKSAPPLGDLPTEDVAPITPGEGGLSRSSVIPITPQGETNTETTTEITTETRKNDDSPPGGESCTDKSLPSPPSPELLEHQEAANYYAECWKSHGRPKHVNGTQFEFIGTLVKEYGIKIFREAVDWAALKGTSDLTVIAGAAKTMKNGNGNGKRKQRSSETRRSPEKDAEAEYQRHKYDAFGESETPEERHYREHKYDAFG